MSKWRELIHHTLTASDFGTKRNPWIGILIHHTGIGERDPKSLPIEMWQKLNKNISEYLSRKDDKFLSAHFMISREGYISLLVDPDRYTAYHAGQSSWFHPEFRKVLSNMNDHMIGIELLGDGNRGPYSEEQYDALGKLCAALLQDYETIEPRNITGHENVSPGRKTDPGLFFDWRKLFNKIYGASNE
jgi:N-acetyl-anhydromuramoyl-L-alanine amidase